MYFGLQVEFKSFKEELVILRDVAEELSLSCVAEACMTDLMPGLCMFHVLKSVLVRWLRG